MVTVFGEIDEHLSGRAGADNKGALDCGDKKAEMLCECVVSVNTDRLRQCRARGATAYRAGQDTGQRDKLDIDLSSLSFFVKQDPRTKVRALFKSLPIHIHIYRSVRTSTAF